MYKIEHRNNNPPSPQQTVDMEPKLEQMAKTLVTKRESITKCQNERGAKVENCKNEEDNVKSLKVEVETLQKDSDEKLMGVKDKLEGIF